MADIRTNALPLPTGSLDLTAAWFVVTSTPQGTLRFPMTYFLPKSGGTVDGNLTVTGNNTIEGNATIAGNVTVTGANATFAGNVTVTGTLDAIVNAAEKATNDGNGDKIDETYLKGVDEATEAEIEALFE